MSGLEIMAIAFGLAMDAFAVSIAAGLTLPKVTGGHVLRLSWNFGLFQFMMPILGWAAGRTFAAAIETWDHWVAFGLLAFVGLHMLYEALHPQRDTRERGDPTRGLRLWMLSIATSIDALAVGLTIAFLRQSVWVPALIIGLVAGGMTVIGIRFGSRLGHRWEVRAEVLGGLVLIFIGARILYTHLV
ncbi:MAG: manganese efflux pump [Planctomycetes bacterium]|jgi:putative Mn2+ efflux pump MntP|nr:manganese efflux pump [Planctomycetota bacterium]